MLGEIKIYFGKVASITDTDKLYRCQIVINGKNDNIEPANLPWYFPWYGINYLPEVGDMVPVIIFDNDLSTGFYNRSVGRNDDLLKSDISEDDYETYLEIYKRLIDDNNVQLSYSKTNGVEFINNDKKIQIELDKITIFSGSNSIMINDDKIEIGNEAKEASLLGDTSVKHFENIIKHQNDTISEMLGMFDAIQKAAMPGPFTAGIGAALLPLIIKAKIALPMANSKLKTNNSQLQSKKVYIE